MIPKDDARGGAEPLDVAKDGQRVGTAVYEITDKPEPVLGRIESDLLDETFQSTKTALHIANCVRGHAASLPRGLRKYKATAGAVRTVEASSKQGEEAIRAPSQIGNPFMGSALRSCC